VARPEIGIYLATDCRRLVGLDLSCIGSFLVCLSERLAVCRLFGEKSRVRLGVVCLEVLLGRKMEDPGVE
jgi:hypothetical protein